MRSVIASIVLAVICLVSPTASRAESGVQLANAVTAVFQIEHAISLTETTGTLTFSNTANRTLDTMVASIAASDLTDPEKVAVTTVLAVVRQKATNPDRLREAFVSVNRSIENGSWVEFGIPPEILPPPTPELRAKITMLLVEWVEGRMAIARQQMCETP